MCGTKQVGFCSDWCPYYNYATPRITPHPMRGLELILGLMQSVTTMASANFKESYPQVPVAWITEPATDSLLSGCAY